MRTNHISNLHAVTWRLLKGDPSSFEEFSKYIAQEGDKFERELTVRLQQRPFLLVTCQRVLVSWYGSSANASVFVLLNQLSSNYGLSYEKFQGEEAFVHLSQVASSLDSLVLGEPQVLGQFKKAVSTYQNSRGKSTELAVLLKQVTRAASRVMSETNLPKGKVSVLSLLEQQIKTHLDAFGDGGRILVFGTGEMGSNAVRFLLSRVTKKEILWVTRRADLIKSQRYQGIEVASFDSIIADPPVSTLLISAMNVEAPFLTKEFFAKLTRKTKERTILTIDLSMPSSCDVEDGSIDRVRVRRMQDFRSVTEKQRQRRQKARQEAEYVIAEQMLVAEELLVLGAERQKIVELRQDLEEIAAKRLDDIRPALNSANLSKKTERFLEATLKEMIHASQRHLERAILESVHK